MTQTYAAVIILAAFFFTRCADKKEHWVGSYAEVKCAYQREKDAMAADSARVIVPLVKEREDLLKKINEAAAPFNAEIDRLKAEIAVQQNNYKKEYRIVTDKHNDKYGHVSTPQYKNAISRLQLTRDERVAAIQEKIKAVQSRREADKNYRELTGSLELLDEKIKAGNDQLKRNHVAAFDSLQNVLNSLNHEYKTIVTALSAAEKQTLEARRDSIRENPCGHDGE
jgi:hypothetical protein